MKIWVYTFTYNNEELLPAWLKYYEAWVERIIVYDNNSTDRTQEIARQHPRVELRTFDCPYHPEPEPLTTLRNTVWQEARGQADWVLLPDSDELIYHDIGVPAYLQWAQDKGYTVIRTYGWEVAADCFPKSEDILATCHSGIAMPDYSKPVVFMPSQVVTLNLSRGNMDIAPVGNIHRLTTASLALLHCKHLGIDYFMARTALCRKRRDLQQNPTPFPHFDRPDEVLRQEHFTFYHRRVRITL